MERGKLDQVCPACGLWEAAGSYCTRCLFITGPETYYLKGDVAERQRRQSIAGKIGSPPATRGRGRPRKSEAA